MIKENMKLMDNKGWIYKIIGSLFFIFLCLPVDTWSQVYQEEITVVAPYEPTISDAVKISLSPNTLDTASLKKNFTYTIQSTILPTPYTYTPLKPARLAGEPLTKLYSNYLRAGMGTYATPTLDYYYNSQRSKDLNYGVRAKHLSSRGDIPESAFPGMSQNLLGLNLRHIGKKGLTKHADLSYTRDVIHYYGFTLPDSVDMPKQENYKQRYQQLKLDLGMYKHDSDKKKLYFDTRLQANHFSTLSDNREITAVFGVNLRKNFSFFDFSEVQELSVLAEATVLHTTLADTSLGAASLVTIQPSFRTRLGEFDLHAGLRADVMTDSASSLQLSPVAGIKIDVLEHALCISFGLSGHVHQRGLRSYVMENPFLGDQITRAFEKTRLRVYGGLDGRLGRHIGFSTSLSVSKIDDASFFVNDTTIKPWSVFTLEHDDVNLFEAKAAFSFNFSKKWQSKLRLHYQKYSLGDIPPWHVPELSGSYMLIFNLKDKIILKTELFGASERLAPDFNQEGILQEKVLTPYLDINLGAEYRYSKILSGFVELNNLSNRHYEIWNGFGTQGLRFMAGLTYSF